MNKLLRLWLIALALLVIPASFVGCRAEVDDDNGEAEVEVGD